MHTKPGKALLDAYQAQRTAWQQQAGALDDYDTDATLALAEECNRQLAAKTKIVIRPNLLMMAATDKNYRQKLKTGNYTGVGIRQIAE